MLPFLLGCGYYARVLPTQFPREIIVTYAAGGNILSWVAQFMGHGLAEGRAPALLDNLFQVHISKS
jgi:2-hydroxy fatty acid dioxygenase